MPSHASILDEREALKRPFYGSVVLHTALVVTLVAGNWIQSRRKPVSWGDINGGGPGSVAVNVVNRIPLPTESGAPNPVATDTQSRVPEPQSQVKTPPKAAAQAPPKDLNSIPISSRNALKKASQSASAPNKFRDAQKDQSNQLYSRSGQRMVAPDMVAMAGSGDVSFGNNSAFGTQFGPYAGIVKNKVAQNWRTGQLTLRTRSAAPVVVTFTIRRNGSTPENSVKVRQTSGNQELDLSAQRAILEAAPFPPLPAQFSGSSVDVEFWFTLKQ
jgi:periplasmic protein TonB